VSATFAIILSLVLATASSGTSPSTADMIRDRQWHLVFLDAASAHGLTRGQGIIVAVIDTGVDAHHPDLAGSVLAGKAFVSGESDGRTDKIGHGTGMAGLIAAHGRNGSDGALGIAPAAMILPVLVSTNLQTGDVGDELGPAIDYAVANQARVINISLAGGRSPRLEKAIQAALSADVVVVAGAGNTDVSLGLGGPASYPGVVAVGAVDKDYHHLPTSVKAPEVMISAPGVDIVSTNAGGGYRIGTGTSDATAIVSGAAALVRARFPNLSAAEVVHRLTATATDAGPPGRDEEYGFGVLNLVDALTKDVPPIQGTPTAPVRPTTRVAGPNPGNSGGVPSGLLFAAIALLLVAGGAWTLFRRRTG
jgi:type VII secretion-associated serine protease mycosin